MFATTIVGLVLSAARLYGAKTVRIATHAASLLAVTLGAVWFVERVSGTI